MTQEKYGIRADWSRFGADLADSKAAIASLAFKEFKDDYPVLVKTAETVRFMRDMCRAQSLNVIGPVKSVLALGACANQIDTMKNVLVEEEGFKELPKIKSQIIMSLDNLMTAVNLKADAVLIENQAAIESEEPDENGVFKTLSGAMQTVREVPKTPEEQSYEKINLKLAEEKARVAKYLESLGRNQYIEITGSVAVNHFFREQTLQGLDYSIIKGKGFEFSRSRRETVTPMHIFHGQTIVAIKLKVGRFIYADKVLTPNEKKAKRDNLFQMIRSSIHEDYPGMLEITQDIEPGYLYSKAFKGILFLWFVTPEMRKTLDRFPENKVSLMWD